MSAYIVLTQDVSDENRYMNEYVPGAMPFIAKHGGEVLVADFNASAMQGSPPACVVVGRFPSEQAARDFLDDPDYQPLKQLRLDITTNANMVVAPEFSMPA